MRELIVVLGDVIDEHVQVGFYFKDTHGRRSLGSLAVPCEHLNLVVDMVESAQRAAEVDAALDPVNLKRYTLRTSGRT